MAFHRPATYILLMCWSDVPSRSSHSSSLLTPHFQSVLGKVGMYPAIDGVSLSSFLPARLGGYEGVYVIGLSLCFALASNLVTLHCTGRAGLPRSGRVMSCHIVLLYCVVVFW
ncbi:hypothetical protein HDK64DRAFT_259216 [Phyllosticta capitalensis]